MTDKQKKEFAEKSKILIKWMNENCHPHMTAIITPTSYELVEGVIYDPKVHDFIKD